jgi:toxin HigB-1
MIKNFKCSETAQVWRGDISKKLPRSIQQVARRKLRMLSNANQLDDLRVPPNNRLEALKGKRKGQYSIRINKQWRICFCWENNMVFNVEIVDYH